LTQEGKERVLHSFGGATDGNAPHGGLLYRSGTLYGTTTTGGQGGICGTVFTLVP
jgi:hypothetical protein